MNPIPSPTYLIIGNGKVAKHMQYYFSLLNIPYQNWHRQHSQEILQHSLDTASHILLLISDDAIELFIQKHLTKVIKNKIIVHFSGAHVSSFAYGAHPLMTFSENLYSLKQYQEIPFILDHQKLLFDKILPGLSNPHVFLHPSLKAKYHALCVLSGNFSCMLWEKLFMTFQREFNISPKMAYPYLLQQTKNLFNYPPSVLTGPLVRNDQNTIQRNLEALEQDPFLEVYQSFIDCYQKIKSS